MAAYCTIQVAITEMYSDEAKLFAKFPALAEWFIQADSDCYGPVAARKHVILFRLFSCI